VSKVKDTTFVFVSTPALKTKPAWSTGEGSCASGGGFVGVYVCVCVYLCICVCACVCNVCAQ